ncbi:hypothetical protein Tco_0272980 [Tanacetum coccineum]
MGGKLHVSQDQVSGIIVGVFLKGSRRTKAQRAYRALRRGAHFNTDLSNDDCEEIEDELLNDSNLGMDSTNTTHLDFGDIDFSISTNFSLGLENVRDWIAIAHSAIARQCDEDDSDTEEEAKEEEAIGG